MADVKVADPAAGPKQVAACPCCGLPFAASLETNIGHQCPNPPRGCGSQFTVMVHRHGAGNE